jgi:hypothetical protein
MLVNIFLMKKKYQFGTHAATWVPGIASNTPFPKISKHLVYCDIINVLNS